MKPSYAVCSGIVTLILLACSGAPAGAADYCKKDQQCRGGNDADVRACEAAFAGEHKVAVAYDCGGLYDTYVECLGANTICNKSHLDSGDACKGQKKSYEGCVEAASALR